ncbi:MAG: transporter related [Desulfacinum sp.]|jgi:putative ABC transport system ATP-binding protein|nr:transporter related [Desulfacinum sp.]
MVRLEGLVKTRSQNDSVFELHVPHFRVEPGSMVAVVGESGCGKSTLLDLLALVMAPTRVERFEIAISPTAPPCDAAGLWRRGDEAALAALRREHFGYILQTGGLLPFLSVRSNVELPGAINGGRPPSRSIQALARDLGIESCLDRMPSSLSIGQRQRAAILRALAHGPRLVLADEPTAAVDKARARTIMDDMHRLAREQRTAVVVVTHDRDLVLDLADAVYSFDLQVLSATETRSVCRPVTGGKP